MSQTNTNTTKMADVNVIVEARKNAYGPAEEDFTRTAGMWSALGFRFQDPQRGLRNIEPKDIPPAMIMVKLSREAHAHKADNVDDIKGYALTLDRVHEKLYVNGELYVRSQTQGSDQSGEPEQSQCQRQP